MSNEKPTKLCPLCNQPNQCGQPKSSKDECWCFKSNVRFPKALLNHVPKEKLGKACICQQCVKDFAKKNAIIHKC
ncbi:cysteine-rich CWC family protein [Vibrio astriarenae]|uniref:cysteine-rich CWC family protein n=1 Tax=Vibrio astriarenae TaxID=1481923 RepID=UPI003734D1D9